MKKKKVVIIGSGPAAYTAAVYAARADLKPLVFEGFYSGTPGGQLMTTTEVENFPGFPNGISGPELVDLFRQQAIRFGSCLIQEDVIGVKLDRRPFEIEAPSGIVSAGALIIATGANAKRLDIPGTRDHEFWQKGVTSCAVCDGPAPIFRGKHLFVIGGGDTAVEEALLLTRFGSKVFIVHRRDRLRASVIMAQRALAHPKIEVLWNTVLTFVKGEQTVSRVVLKDVVTEKESEREAGGVFFAIGHQPNTSFLKNHLELHENGYIKVVPGSTETNIKGVFAAGDVQDHLYRQAITAAGTGCMAALDAERWLASQEDV